MCAPIQVEDVELRHCLLLLSLCEASEGQLEQLYGYRINTGDVINLELCARSNL